MLTEVSQERTNNAQTVTQKLVAELTAYSSGETLTDEEIRILRLLIIDNVQPLKLLPSLLKDAVVGAFKRQHLQPGGTPWSSEKELISSAYVVTKGSFCHVP